jgi:hypothetical protein
MKYFHASTMGRRPVMAPEGYRVDLLSLCDVPIAAANRALYQYRFSSGQTKFAVLVGLGSRLTGHSNYLRMLAVQANCPTDPYGPQGIVMEGSPMANFCGFDCDPRGLIDKVDRHKTETLDLSYRALAGFFNTLRALGIVNGRNHVPNKRLMGLMGSPVLGLIFGSLLQDPISGFENLMKFTLAAGEPRVLSIQASTIYLDRMHQGNEKNVAKFLSMGTVRTVSKNAWQTMRYSDEKQSSEIVRVNELEVTGQIGQFSVDVPDGTINIDTMNRFDNLDSLVNRGVHHGTWYTFLSRLVRAGDRGPADFVGIPIGSSDNCLLLIGRASLAEVVDRGTPPSTIADDPLGLAEPDLDDSGAHTIDSVGNWADEVIASE